MSQAPIMPMATDAMIADTTHLTAEEFGAYHLILYATWRNNGVPLADDDRRMARVCRVTPARWRRLRQVLSAFFDLSAGSWRQKRLEKEWDYVSERRRVLRQNGAKGGRAKARRYHETRPAEANAPPLPNAGTQNPNPDPIPDPEESPPSSPQGERGDVMLDDEKTREGASAQEAEDALWLAFWAAYPSRGRYANPRLPARQRFLALVRQGVSGEEMIAAAAHYGRDMAEEAERRLVAQAQTFLKQRRWEQYRAPADGGAAVCDPARKALAAERWAARARRWAALLTQSVEAGGRVPPFIKEDDIGRLQAEGLISAATAEAARAAAADTPRGSRTGDKTPQPPTRATGAGGRIRTAPEEG